MIRSVFKSNPLVCVVHVILFLGYFSLSLFLWVLLGCKSWGGVVQEMQGGGAEFTEGYCVACRGQVHYLRSVQRGCHGKIRYRKSLSWEKIYREQAEFCRIFRPQNRPILKLCFVRKDCLRTFLPCFRKLNRHLQWSLLTGNRFLFCRSTSICSIKPKIREVLGWGQTPRSEP